MNAEQTVVRDERIALVTGSARRLGRHLALTLSELGYGVLIDYRTSADDANALVGALASEGRYARAVQADISDQADVAALFRSISEREGRLDLLVNNVGIYQPQRLVDVTPDDWDLCLRTNLSGPYYCCYHGREMLERSPGSQIVNIGYSGVDALVGNPWATPYQVSKTGLLVLTKSLAEALAPTVRVNMISPGQLENSVDLPEDLEREIPMGRAGTLDDIAGALKYLLEAEYVTGVNIDVAGGYRLRGSC